VSRAPLASEAAAKGDAPLAWAVQVAAALAGRDIENEGGGLRAALSARRRWVDAANRAHCASSWWIRSRLRRSSAGLGAVAAAPRAFAAHLRRLCVVVSVDVGRWELEQGGDSQAVVGGSWG
jgi:hypothetical protein